jgi:apurinic endonuclease APN1
MWIGSHIDASEGDLDCLLRNYHQKSGGKTVQIVGGSQRFRKLAPDVCKYLRKVGMKLFIHSPFSLNLAKEVTFENALGAEGCVLHFGKSVKLDRAQAEQHFYDNLVYVLENTTNLKAKLYIETCAGQGTDLYATKDGSLDELVRFYSQFTEKQKEKIKLCVDTCHIFAAGYDINNEEGAEAFWMEWQHKLGIESLGVIHMNNSSKPFQSHVDRHAALAHGHIGIRGLTTFAQHADMHEIPMIIETPFLEYDIPVLDAMINERPIPNIEGIRRESQFAMISQDAP